MDEDDAREDFLLALRAWGAMFGEVGRHFALQAGMHGTDAAALVHIVNAEQHGEPLTQAELSRSVGLTTGATSSLLNRLESAGHIERRRDRADRRVVTLRSSPAVHEQVDRYFDGVADEINRIVDEHRPDELARFTALLARITDSTQRHLLDPDG
ncbi:MAG: MarR family transcriptional regulator [Microbacterium arborescens]